MSRFSWVFAEKAWPHVVYVKISFGLEMAL